MDQRPLRLSFRGKLVLVVAALAGGVVATVLVAFPGRMETLARDWADNRARTLTQVLAQGLAQSIEYDDPVSANELLGTLRGRGGARDVKYAAILREGRRWAGWGPMPPRNLGGGTAAPRLVERDGTAHVVMSLAPSEGSTNTLVLGFDLEQLHADLRANVTFVVGVSIALFLAALILSFVIGTYLVRPIQEMTQLTKRVAEGDLVEGKAGLDRIRARSTDEVGDLATSFSIMVEKLRDIPLNLSESAGLLAEAVQRLNATSVEQAEMINRQASALQEAQTTVQEIRQTSTMAAQKAQAVLEVAERADTVGKAGEKAIESSLDALTEIRTQVDSIAQRIVELSERTRQIGLITETVKDLADQSNILALNAAIEAVRSGEHGKGFAVVAREIRSLADQSIQATQRVREILDDISTAIRGAVQITEKGAQRMEGGLVQVKSSGENLRELSGIVRDNSAAVRQIAAAVNQQNAGVTQIFAAVSDLNGMMDETLKRIEGTNTSVTRLREAADRVSTVVNSFKI